MKTQNFRVPLEEWLEESDDDELVDRIRRRAPRSPRERLICAGMLARLEAPPEDAQAREQLVELVRAGDAPLDAQRRWASRLDDDQARALAALAQGALEELRERLCSGKDFDATELEELCEARDDLECLRVLVLPHRQLGRDLDGQLVELDRQATALLEELEPEVLIHPSMRLQRVALQRPGVWWVERLAGV